VCVKVGDDALLGRIDPPAFLVETGAGADGVDDFVGGGDDAFCFFDDEFEGTDGVAATFGVAAGGLDVAVDCGGVEDAEFAGDACGAVLVEVVELDGCAVGVATDGASDFVVSEVGAAAFTAFAGRCRLQVVVAYGVPHVASLVGWDSAPTDVNTIWAGYQIGTHLNR
jgi:hypothetical protein